MFDKYKFINEIVNELSYRVGIPNLSDYGHIQILREILKERKVPMEAINILTNTINKNTVTEDSSFYDYTQNTSTNVQTHMTSSEGGSVGSFIDPLGFQNRPPVGAKERDDDGNIIDDEDDPKVESYIFNPDAMQIEKTGNTISLDEVNFNNKFKCFMTGDVYFETKNGTLVKESDVSFIDKLDEKAKQAGKKFIKDLENGVYRKRIIE